MPTPAELAALDYTGGSPSAGGMTAGDYRGQMQQHGRPFRWWKAYQVPPTLIGTAAGPGGEVVQPNGRVYVEQTLASAVRCLLYSTAREVEDREFGLIPKGSTGIGVMPDECELARLDEVAFPDVAWIARELVTRGTGSADELAMQPVSSIISVLLSGVMVSSSRYSVTTGGTGITWAAGAGTPTAGATYAVEYRYLPRFVFLGDEHGVVQRGPDGLALPQRGVIQMKLPT